MFAKRVLAVLVIAALAAAVMLAARVPLVSGQGVQPTKVELTPYEGNPVLPRGAAGEWDSGVVFGGAVIVHENLFHMFYTGDDVDLLSNPAAVPAIGYATSEDGLHWTKYESNPVLEADLSLSPGGFLFAVPLVEGDTWVLYLTTGQTPGQWGGKVLRATAPAPTGPWAVDSQPILEPGGFADWDHSIYPSSLVRTESEYVLYYLGASSSSSITIALGRATSPDGITWTKYDNPATTDALYAHSDPVFTRGKPAVGMAQVCQVGWSCWVSMGGNCSTTGHEPPCTGRSAMRLARMGSPGHPMVATRSWIYQRPMRTSPTRWWSWTAATTCTIMW